MKMNQIRKEILYLRSEILYQSEPFTVYHTWVEYNEYVSFHKIYAEVNSIEIAYVKFYAGKRSNNLEIVIVRIEPEFRNTEINNIMISCFNQLYYQNFKDFNFRYVLAEKRLRPYIERKVKYGKLPKKAIYSRGNNRFKKAEYSNRIYENKKMQLYYNHQMKKIPLDDVEDKEWLQSRIDFLEIQNDELQSELEQIEAKYASYQKLDDSDEVDLVTLSKRISLL